jgi:hypothetical protein
MRVVRHSRSIFGARNGVFIWTLTRYPAGEFSSPSRLALRRSPAASRFIKWIGSRPLGPLVRRVAEPPFSAIEIGKGPPTKPMSRRFGHQTQPHHPEHAFVINDAIIAGHFLDGLCHRPLSLSFTPGCLPFVNSIPAASSAIWSASRASSDTILRDRSKSTTVDKPSPAAWASSGCVRSNKARCRSRRAHAIVRGCRATARSHLIA